MRKKVEGLKRFGRKVLGRSFGPVVQRDINWRIGINFELDTVIKSENIVKFVKSQRINSRLGHVYRIEKTTTYESYHRWKLLEFRPKGRPRKSWMECVEEDLKIMVD